MFFSLTSNLFGQGYPKGVYMSLRDITEKNPSHQSEVNVERSPKSEDVGYLLFSVDNSEKKNFFKKKAYGYSDGEKMYINGRKFKTQDWYSEVLSDGRYIVFKGGALRNDPNVAMAGVMFGAIGAGIASAKQSKKRYVYAFDKDTGRTTVIHMQSIQKFLEQDSGLLESYMKEENMNAPDILIEYMARLNESLKDPVAT